MDTRVIKDDFPFFTRFPGYTYLDNAATTQKPRCVIDKLTDFYETTTANVHRGMYRMAIEATDAYEGARNTARDFLNAAHREEIIFTRGTTEGLNLLASTLPKTLKAGDGILLSGLEHHSNLVPWQLAAETFGLKLYFIETDDEGELLWDDFKSRWPENIKLVSVTIMSHVFGTRTPFEDIIATAHARDVPVILDAAQAAPRMKIDVRAIDCDFLVFSGHKTYGPTGIGILYGKKELLERLPVWQAGGDMISSVWREKATWNDLPWRFEAGTPAIAQAVGLGEALKWLAAVRNTFSDDEATLTRYIQDALQDIGGITLYGRKSTGIVSFNMGMVHAHDMGQFLDSKDVAVRTGHHCAHPVMRQLGIPATVRASLGIYTDSGDADRFVAAVKAAKEYFTRHGL